MKITNIRTSILAVPGRNVTFVFVEPDAAHAVVAESPRHNPHPAASPAWPGADWGGRTSRVPVARPTRPYDLAQCHTVRSPRRPPGMTLHSVMASGGANDQFV